MVRPVWPEYWNIEELEKVKASLSVRNWSAQYMQEPSSEEGAIYQKNGGIPWPHDMPILKTCHSKLRYGFSKKETADYSAITTWGIFKPDDGAADAIMLIDAIRGRFDFPELKMVALDQYKYWQPETT